MIMNGNADTVVPHLRAPRLLAEARAAVDPQLNGLLDRHDYIRMLEEFISLSEELLAMHEGFHSQQADFVGQQPS
jgi:hypothetical protein